MNTREEIQVEIERLGRIVPWYHRFEFANGVIISGWEGIYGVWENIRKVRKRMCYQNMRVLDLGCRDGMWAFEAEKLFAAVIVATDIGDDGYREHISFIKAMTHSRIAVYFNVSTEDAFARLDCFFACNPGLFEIVQHLGLLYHVENPLLSLRETRKCLCTGGTLLLETAFYMDGNERPLALFNSKSDIYTDPNTYWAFNLSALCDALKLTGFAVDEESISTIKQSETIGRVCLTAKAV